MLHDVYLIGSLRNEKVLDLGNKLRARKLNVFDDWFAAGPEADDYWQRYEKEKGKEYPEGLKGYAARHVYEFDKWHLDRSLTGVLLLPAGKSGHLELGYLIGQGKPGFICMEHEPDRWDVMYCFTQGVFYDWEELIERVAAAVHHARVTLDISDLRGKA